MVTVPQYRLLPVEVDDQAPAQVDFTKNAIFRDWGMVAIGKDDASMMLGNVSLKALAASVGELVDCCC
uniref:Uncharacterized protein n=1 Tax=Romanomermis culicivorax TaxID=13658 RepID=A0A915JIX9_ROMCU